MAAIKKLGCFPLPNEYSTVLLLGGLVLASSQVAWPLPVASPGLGRIYADPTILWLTTVTYDTYLCLSPSMRRPIRQDGRGHVPLAQS